ncbi:MAG: phenylalanine--tRNA ligase subunit beta [Actinomycetota bacterium]
MKAPISWLRDFVDIELPAEQIAERLSLTGLTVDGVIRLGNDVQGVIVAEVSSKQDHPDADRLKLVTVNDGSQERSIVCGADNYQVGDRVPLAPPGAVLPGGFQIAERKVRGQLSQGMLCSAKELGLGADHSGILICDPDAELGADLLDALDLLDAVLDIDVLPNRPDALSILGVAREIAMLFGLELRCPPLPEAKTDGSVGIAIEVSDTEGCPLYTARVIRGIEARGTSPWWLRRRLIAAGMRPIDPIVDATNHTMLELGQPLHAFDLGTLKGGKIVVRKAMPGETIRTLDGQDRGLAEGDVLICDAERPIAVAGVMGGEDTEVSGQTTDILLESAAFDPRAISRTARRLDLRSEAAQRFERGVDPDVILDASERCAALIASLVGGTPSSEVASDGPGPTVAPTIHTTAAAIDARLGTALGDAIPRLLERVGCDVEVSGDQLSVVPPSWRPDIGIAEDLSEEVARLYGYEQIPSIMPSGSRIGGLTDEQRRARVVREHLSAIGLNEQVGVSIISPHLLEVFELAADHPWTTAPHLANPLSADDSILRPSLLPGLIDAASSNTSRRVLPVGLFEIGTCFTRRDTNVDEVQAVAGVLYGEASSGLYSEVRPFDALDAKAAIETLATRLGAELTFEPTDIGMPMHPGRSAWVLLGGDYIGAVGELHPRICEELGMPGRVALFELSLGPLLASRGPMIAPVPLKQPPIQRDIAIVAPTQIAAAQIAQTVKDAAGELLESCQPFDRYEGGKLGEGMVSLALALTFRAADRTLTDEEAGELMARIEDAVREQGWTVRV